MKKLPIPILLLWLALLTSCVRPKQEQRVITVTIEPLRYFTEQIVGDKFKVMTLVPKGSNPETYEPQASQMIDLSDSPLYLTVGNIGFERTWAGRLAANAPDTKIVSTSKGIKALKDADGHEDPHTWMSTTNAATMAKNIYAAVVGLDSKDSTYFKRNLQRLLHDIDATDKYIRNVTSASRQKAFLIFHPTLSYFARDYGLRQISLETEGRELSAMQIQQCISLAKAQNVRTFFVQKEFASRNTDAVARAVNARKVEINPLGYDWKNEMKNIADHLK